MLSSTKLRKNISSVNRNVKRKYFNAWNVEKLDTLVNIVEVFLFINNKVVMMIFFKQKQMNRNPVS